MGSQFIKFDLKFLHVIGFIMSLENRICDGILSSLFFRYRQISLVLGNDFLSVLKINAGIVKFHFGSSNL